ncbi:MAG: hypothetical protein ACP5N1_01240 [Candidatus Woesearchaeota archaeon]
MNTNERIEKYFENNLVEMLNLDDYIVTDVDSAVKQKLAKEKIDFQESKDLSENLRSLGIVSSDNYVVKNLSETEIQKYVPKSEHTQLLSIENFFSQNEFLMKTYPMIDLSFFDMNKSVKLSLPEKNDELATLNMPMFMLYTLNLEKPKIFLKRYSSNVLSGFELSIDGLSLMKDHSYMLQQWCNSVKNANSSIIHKGVIYQNKPLWGINSESYQIKAPTLTSIMPEDVTNEITKAQKIFGNQVYVVPYVNEWFVQGFETGIISRITPRIINENMKEDPLVIAGNPEQIKNGYGFLIASFDPVLMEDYVVKTYSGGKPMQN